MSESSVAAVRRFNRLYTQRIGVVTDNYAQSEMPLPLARALYEIASAGPLSPGELAQRLGHDDGYVSRVVANLEERGLIARDTDPNDGRRKRLHATSAGMQTFARMDRQTAGEIAALLAPLAPAATEKIVSAMETIAALLEGPSGPIVIREHQPGDIGWMIRAHGELYTREFGWDPRFEGFVAEIGAAFLKKHDPARERCWIAERDGVNVGSIMCVAKSKHVAKLRVLLVDPSTRGTGLGTRLVKTCIAFARRAGYHAMTLFTYDSLVAARRIYEREGFVCTASEPDASFAAGLLNETWDLDLRRAM